MPKIFVSCLIHQVGCASQIFFPQNCFFITVNLLLWTDIAVECVWLFSRNPPDERIDFLMINFAILLDSQFYSVKSSKYVLAFMLKKQTNSSLVLMGN